MDHLIEALRWDPANHRALVMMGNLWAQVKQEPHTAIIYYREALKHQPNDHIGATNLGAMLLREGRTEEAVEVLQQAARTDPTYPNSHPCAVRSSMRVRTWARVCSVLLFSAPSVMLTKTTCSGGRPAFRRALAAASAKVMSRAVASSNGVPPRGV